MGAECLVDYGYDFIPEDLAAKIWLCMDRLKLIPRELRGFGVARVQNLGDIYVITFCGEVQGYLGSCESKVAISPLELTRPMFRMTDDVRLFLRLVKEAEDYALAAKNKRKYKKAFGKDMPE